MLPLLSEREIFGVGELTPDALRDASRPSNSALAQMGPKIPWPHSYQPGDRICSTCNAPKELLIREQAERSGLPVSRITPISAISIRSACGRGRS